MQRIVPIDMARGLAIIFALTSHALSQFTEGLASIADAMIWVKLFTRSATPMFYVLFGIVLHIVYLRKARVDFIAIQQRLIARAILCYTLFVAITLAGFVSGKYDFIFFAKSIALLENGRFGIILGFYALHFGFIAVTLKLALRWGFLFFAVTAGAAWVTRLFLILASAPRMPGVQQLIGHGEGMGPALILSLTFVAFGVAIGEAWEKRRSWLVPALVFLASVLVLIVDSLDRAIVDYLYALVFAYRWQNHPAYFAYGILMTTTAIAVMVFFNKAIVVSPNRNWLTRMGSETLYAFALGNVILNLLPVYEAGEEIGLFYACIYLAIMAGLVLRRRQITKLANLLTGGGVSGVAEKFAVISASFASHFVNALLHRNPVAVNPMTASNHSNLRQ